MVIGSCAEAVFAGVPESVTVTVTVEVPGVVGVPLTVQLVRVKPAGREPVMEHVYGVVPPLAVTVELNGTPTVPLGNVFVSVNAAGSITMVSGPVVDCVGFPASVTLTEIVALPAVMGVPATAHPERVRPAGSDPDVITQP